MWCGWGLIYFKSAFAFSGPNFITKIISSQEGRQESLWYCELNYILLFKKSKLSICITSWVTSGADILIITYHKICIFENTVSSSGAPFSFILCICLFLIFPQGYVLLISERGGGSERGKKKHGCEREKLICCTLTRNQMLQPTEARQPRQHLSL